MFIEAGTRVLFAGRDRLRGGVGPDRCELRAVTSRTRRTYDFTWQRFGAREVERHWEKDSYAYGELIPRELTDGKGLGLDAGCGGGADLLRMAGRGTPLIGVDLSEGAAVAARLTKHLPHVNVLQADLHQLPLKPGSFDFIYSFGVLHHLPDPAQGFQQLAALLKPGAPLITYLYEDFGDCSRIERALLQMIRIIRMVSSRLPAPLLHGLCWLAVPFVWISCSVPAYLLRRRLPRLAQRLPFRHTLRWSVLASDLFDRFAPPMEWRYDPAAIRRLYEDAGLQDVELRQYRGWVSWGFKPVEAAPAADAAAVAAQATVRPAGW